MLELVEYPTTIPILYGTIYVSRCDSTITKLTIIDELLVSLQQVDRSALEHKITSDVVSDRIHKKRT